MDLSSQSTISHSLLTSEAIELLTRTGIASVRKFLETRVEDICATTQLHEVTVHRIQQDLKKLLEIQKVEHQSTGIESLDDFLGGGLVVGHVYEMCGTISAGKTKFCHTIALKLAQRGIGCLYVDMNGDLIPPLMMKMLMDMGETKERLRTVLDLIRVEKIRDFDELKPLLQYVVANWEALERFGLLIVDSVAVLHVLSFNQDRDSRARNAKLVYNLLHGIAKDGKFTVILTNLLVTHKDDQKILPGLFNIGLRLNETVPELAFTRLRIDAPDQRSAQRDISVISSNHLSRDAKVSLQLTDKGLI